MRKNQDLADIKQRLAFTCRLARNIGLEALSFWQENGSDQLGVENKGLQDFVTIADKKAEESIKAAIKKQYPEDGFIGEETGGHKIDGGYWVVDPIDGTANYMRGLRHWGVSIAYVKNGETKLGVVHDAATDRIYAATLGGGATCENKTIKIAMTKDPHKMVGIVGVSRRSDFNIYLNQLRNIYDAGIEYRKIGSAAIGIVRMAEGVVDFYYEKHLNAWDVLAALLIAQEAGAAINLKDVDRFIKNGGEILSCIPQQSILLKKLLLEVG